MKIQILPYPLFFTAPDKINYIKSKLLISPRYEGNEKVNDFEVNNYLAFHNGRDTFPEFALINRAKIPAPKKDFFVQYEKDLLETVNRDYPLLENEQVEEDQLGYLISDYDGVPAQSLLLHRTTNLSVCLFINLQSRINPYTADLTFGKTSLATVPSFSSINMDFSFNARKIAKSLTGKADFPYNVIASMALDVVWPSEKEAGDDINSSKESLQKIARMTLAQERIKVGKIKLEGYVNFNHTQYRHLRDDPKVPKLDRMNALRPYDGQFYTETVATFMINEIKDERDKALAIECLGSFLYGANLHLALNQERHLQDVNESQAFLETVRSLAKLYIQYAESMKSVMISYRTHFIGTIRSFSTISSFGEEFTDHFTKKTEKIYLTGKPAYAEIDREASESLKSKRRALLAQVSQEQENYFEQNVQTIINDWRLLLNDPVPAVE